MTLNKPLWEKAEHLASQGYDIEMFKDTLTNGDIVILAKNPELPGCMAHGATHDEAIANLTEARTEYIYSLLLDELPVPYPRGKTVNTVSQNVAVDNRVIFGFGTKMDNVFEPDTRDDDISYLYRGNSFRQR